MAAACDIEEQGVDYSGDEIRRLLSGDSIKHWIRLSYTIQGSDADADECSLKHMLIFKYNDTSSPDLEFEIRTLPIFCNGTDSTLITGNCIITDVLPSTGTNDSISFVTAADTINYVLIQATSLVLKMERRINGNLMDEEYRWMEN